MSNTMYLAYSHRQSEAALKILSLLIEAGYDAKSLQNSPKDGDLVLLLLDMESRKDELFASFPWLRDQFEFSSLRALRLMPFLVYRSSEGDIEEQVENHLADTLESVISGEFKPYGFDIDAEDPLKEFASVLEAYEE